ncbi:unnamed protein product [Pylaiella littoralis]
MTAQQHQQQQQHQDETSTSTSGEDDGGDDHGEVSCCLEDTDSFMLRKREFLFPGLPPVVLNQDFVSVEGTGGAVWRPSVLFSSFVCGEEGRRCLPLFQKSVLEISSGLGLGAIVAWHLGAAPVVATDIGAQNGPMALLARNVAENCGRTGAATVNPTGGNRLPPLPTPRENHGAHGSSEAERAGAAGAAAVERATASQQQQRTTRETTFAGGNHPLPSPPSPPPRVQSLRWGDRAQLAEALANFGGVGPDVVLACDVVFDDGLLPALTETLAEACALPTRRGTRPCLCVSTQARNRPREEKFFAGLATRLGGGDWRMVHRRDDLSVLMFTFL